MPRGNPNPSPKTRFQVGENRNPLGAGAQDPQLKAIKNLTKNELIDIGNLLIKGNLTELKAVAQDTSANVLKTMLASVCVKIISKGDVQALNVLLDRLIGKVKDDIHFKAEVSSNIPQIVVTLPSNGREVS